MWLYVKRPTKVYVHVMQLSQNFTFDLLKFLFFFFPKFELPSSGYSLSASVAYLLVFRVYIFRDTAALSNTCTLYKLSTTSGHDGCTKQQ